MLHESHVQSFARRRCEFYRHICSLLSQCRPVMPAGLAVRRTTVHPPAARRVRLPEHVLGDWVRAEVTHLGLRPPWFAHVASLPYGERDRHIGAGLMARVRVQGRQRHADTESVTGGRDSREPLSWRVAVPALRVYAVLFTVAAISLGRGLAGRSPRQPSWTPLLLGPALVLAALAAVWCGLLAGRILLRGDQVRVFGVYRVRSFPVASIAGLEPVDGPWPARGVPAVLPGVHRRAEYLRVRFTDGGVYEPPALCSLSSRAGEAGSLPAIVDAVNLRLGTSRGT